MRISLLTNSLENLRNRKKKRLAYLVPNLLYGAMGNHTYTIVKALDKTKIEVQVWCLYEKGPFAEYIEGLGVSVKLMLRPHMEQFLSLFERVFKNNRCPSVLKKFSFKLINIMKHSFAFIQFFFWVLKWRPSIIHSFHFYSNTCNRLISMLRLVPIAITTETNTTKYNYTTLQSLVTRYLAPYSSKIIAMSEVIKSSLVEHEKICPQKIEVLPTAIDINDLPQKFRFFSSSNSTTVGIVAAIEPRKGHKYFLEAAALVAKKLPMTKFIIAGDGPLRLQMEQYAQQLGISKQVRFTGHFGHISEIMAQIDIFVLSALTDGLSATIMEAMVYSKPVVATNIDGIPELVSDGKTGFLVPARDPAAIAEAILKLIANKKLATNMGNSGRKFVKRFSAETIAKRLEQIYDKV